MAAVILRDPGRRNQNLVDISAIIAQLEVAGPSFPSSAFTRMLEPHIRIQASTVLGSLFEPWETWIGRRGDVARAVMYMAIRYEGDSHGVTGFAEPDLVLTDNASLIQTTSSSPAYMGMLSAILAWHNEDPVDDLERHRADVVWQHQGNRNPFIDHPRWADCVFAGAFCGGIFEDDFESGDLGAWGP